MIPIINGNYPQIVIPMLDKAKTNLDIMMYMWGYYSYNGKSNIQGVNYAIKSAIRRGVPTRVILHPGNALDHLRTKNNEMASHLMGWGAQVKYGGMGKVHHAKIILIDKTIAIFGSHNFSKRSMSTNVEIGVAVEGSAEILEYQKYFDLIWGQT